jgi:hypothetical protein
MASNESVRHQLPATLTMLKYYGEIERMVFAAETYCNDVHDIKPEECTCRGKIDHCPFHNKEMRHCTLKLMRDIIGEP